MAETKEERIERLLAEGLDAYGLGDVGPAILAWEEVLVLDPGNGDARDYIKTADRRSKPRPPKPGAVPPAVRAMVKDIVGLLEQGQVDDALELVSSAAEAQPGSLEIQATLDLVRGRLHRSYREAVGDLETAPALTKGPEELRNLNLPANAGFLLSMIDGQTSVQDLVSLSGMDSFEALRLLRGLAQNGIVRLGG